jgi:uncharacterized protein (DUF736 family)
LQISSTGQGWMKESNWGGDYLSWTMEPQKKKKKKK